MEIPLWDRRFIDEWVNIYLIPDEIYQKIKKNTSVQDVDPERFYIVNYAYSGPFHLKTNFHFISVEEGCENIDEYRFSTDIHRRFGVVQYIWWWYAMNGEVVESFDVIPSFHFEEIDELNRVIAMVYTHYEPNEFSPYIKDPLELKSRYKITDTLVYDIYDTWKELDQTRREIADETLAEELKRLNETEFFQNLVLKISNDN